MMILFKITIMSQTYLSPEPPVIIQLYLEKIFPSNTFRQLHEDVIILIYS